MNILCNCGKHVSGLKLKEVFSHNKNQVKHYKGTCQNCGAAVTVSIEVERNNGFEITCGDQKAYEDHLDATSADHPDDPAGNSQG